MTQINASCDACGPVKITDRDVVLMMCSSNARLSYYSFTCPTCRSLVKKFADGDIPALLMSGGVQPVTWEVPAEALEEHDGSPISLDELIDFGLFLDRNEFIAMHVNEV